MRRLFVPPVVLAVLACATSAEAKPPGPAGFCATFPASPFCAAGQQPACVLCHDAAPPARNAFGAAIAAQLLPGAPRPLSDADYAAALPAALRAVVALDSDGDGVNNLDEISNGSYPGDANSKPGAPTCPADGANPAYAVCHYDARYALRKLSLDFCGEPPTFEELEAIAKMAPADQQKAIDAKLAACTGGEFWAGKNGQVWQLANAKIRPLGALKAGPEETGQLPIADYYHDYRLWAYTQTGDHDCREILTGTYFVKQTGPATYQALSPADEAAAFTAGDQESVPVDKRAGALTSRWMLLYTTMFSVLPRSTAAQAMRAYLDQEIARMEGLSPIGGEPVDFDHKGVTNPTCAACHSTLDPLAYAFRNYNGFTPAGAVNPPGRGAMGRATYVDGRMDWFNVTFPGISAMPSGYIFGQPVGSLMEWAQRAADSDQFARARVNDYWRLLLGRSPTPDDAATYTKLWQDLKTTHDYRIAKMLHDLVHTEAYGAP